MWDGSSQQPGPTTWGDGESCPGGGRASGGRAREGSSQRAHQLRGRGVLPGWRLVPMEGLRETVEPTTPGPPSGGLGVVPRCRSVPMEGLRWLALPNGRGPPAGGTGSPAHTAVGAYGVRVGDGRPQWPGPTSCRDQESCPSGSPCLWSACGGRQIPTPRAHQLGERGVLPRRRWVPMEPLRGMAVPNGPGPPPWGMRSPSQAAVGAYGGPVGDGSSQRPGATI